jgi:hypothetical protein
MVKLYARLFTALMIVIPIGGCAVFRPGPVAVLQNQTETPPPSTSTPRPTSTATPTITFTPTPEPEICTLDPQTELFRDASVGLTVPVLSSQDAREIFGEEVLFEGILSQVAFDIAQVQKSNPTSISKVIVPEYINPSDVRDYLEVDGIIQIDFEIGKFDPDADIKNEKTLLVSVHAGEDGWRTALWRNSSIIQRPDGINMVDGEMMFIGDTDEDGTPELRTLPAQRIGTTKPDVAIVDGCEPSIIRVNEKGEVQAILAENPDLLNPDSIWIQNESVNIIPDASEIISTLPKWSLAKVVEDGEEYWVKDINGTILAEWNGMEWKDTKPLYYECGLHSRPIQSIHEEYKPLGVDGEIMPTGNVGGAKNMNNDAFNLFRASICLLETNGKIPKETFGMDNLWKITVGAWDINGNLNRIPVVIGGEIYTNKQLDTKERTLSYCYSDVSRQSPYKCTFKSAEDVYNELEKTINDPKSNKQIEALFATYQRAYTTAWSFSSIINRNEDINKEIETAISFGKDFPTFSDDYFIYGWEIALFYPPES